MLRLPDVTLLAATAVSIEDTAEALKVCSRQIEFGAVRLLAPARPAVLPPGVEHVAIAPMDFLGYSRFILGELHRHFATSHCLVVQADGFVVNASLWREEFLAYDYVGAPWAEEVRIVPDNHLLRFDRNRVGNGGFSLRSHRLMRMAAELEFDRLDFPLRSEDILLCHYLYEEMRARGATYAPLELAARFAIEEQQLKSFAHDLDTVFGFHGKHLLPYVLKRLPDTDFSALRGRATKLGRNEPCPCGSGRRFKHCHGAFG